MVVYSVVLLVCCGFFYTLSPKWREVPLCAFFLLLPHILLACCCLSDFLEISTSLDLLFSFYISGWRHLLYLVVLVSMVAEGYCWVLQNGKYRITVFSDYINMDA